MAEPGVVVPGRHALQPDARDEPLVAGTKALRNALLEVASHDEAAREELSQCQLLLHSLQGLQMEERSLRAGEIQFARRS